MFDLPFSEIHSNLVQVGYLENGKAIWSHQVVRILPLFEVQSVSLSDNGIAKIETNYELDGIVYNLDGNLCSYGECNLNENPGSHVEIEWSYGL